MASAKGRKKKSGLNGPTKRYGRQAREYRKLLDDIGWTQSKAARTLNFAPRSSRRYARGEAEMPGSALMLLRLLARGDLSEQQIREAAH